MMDYKIEAKEAFTVIGIAKAFHGENAYAEVPKFWCEHHQNGDGEYICGMFGICYDQDSGSDAFRYMIADSATGKGEIPDRFITKKIPAKTWAVFPVKGALPKALQDMNTKIWNEWLPNCREYEPDGSMNIEFYSEGDTNSEDYYSEIWIPVRTK